MEVLLVTMMMKWLETPLHITDPLSKEAVGQEVSLHKGLVNPKYFYLLVPGSLNDILDNLFSNSSDLWLGFFLVNLHSVNIGSGFS